MEKNVKYKMSLLKSNFMRLLKQKHKVHIASYNCKAEKENTSFCSRKN